MFTQKDLEQLNNRGSNLEVIENQLSYFKKGFPHLKVLSPATIGNGIIRLDSMAVDSSVKEYNKKVQDGLQPAKFIPASGAASRMFQSLFSFAEAASSNQKAAELLQEERFGSVAQFFIQLTNFSFYKKLSTSLGGQLYEEGNLKYCEIIDYLLTDKGLNYGFLPKGLLDFHSYLEGPRTPVEEHLIEGALYGADNRGNVKLHFTVSPEHLNLFKEKIAQSTPVFETKFGVHYEISFSEQKPSTDTIAVDPENNPFRLSDGTLLFRPAGHGALLENLNEIEGDIIFIKNIDNVVPDRLKDETVRYKMALVLILLEIQNRIFQYLKILATKEVTEGQLADIIDFTEHELCIKPVDPKYEGDTATLIHYLYRKLNRPIRICGMVLNEGEPGGGPFLGRK